MSRENKRQGRGKKQKQGKLTQSERPDTPLQFDPEKISQNLLVPRFFVDQEMLAVTQEEQTAEMIAALVAHYEDDERKDFLRKVFYEPGETEIPDQIVDSLYSPFEKASGDQKIVWRFSTQAKQKKDEQKDAYSISCVVDANGKVASNIIYDQNGRARIQIDFDGHGSGDVHCHILIPGNFDHTEGEGHSFPWKFCPWMWLAIPEDFGLEPRDQTLDGNQRQTISVTYNPETDYFEENKRSFFSWLMGVYYKAYRENKDKQHLLMIIIVLFSVIMVSAPNFFSRYFYENKKSPLSVPSRSANQRKKSSKISMASTSVVTQALSVAGPNASTPVTELDEMGVITDMPGYSKPSRSKGNDGMRERRPSLSSLSSSGLSRGLGAAIPAHPNPRLRTIDPEFDGQGCCR